MNEEVTARTEALLEEIRQQRETAWGNPRWLPFDLVRGLCDLVVSEDDIAQAEARLHRFAPFLCRAFPETQANGGLIESPLVEIPAMRQALAQESGGSIPGRLFLKKDSHLAIAGSVKARGGIYEVLQHAEELALAGGKITPEESYEKFDTPEMRAFLGQYTVQVGSTGNLGLSIGIMSAALGFRVVVHMSADAKQWKKELLRSKGVEVIEYAQDYSKAVEEGRRQSEADPTSYFVDDEKSVPLFLGYAVAAGRLAGQMKEQGVTVDASHPLLVYIPAGVGGAPGGVSYGLKRLYGDHVHCFFVEPVQCPSVLLGIATQKFEKANVRDYGLMGKTEADGLACASPSSFVTRIMTNLLSGAFTVRDGKLYDYLRLLYRTEGEQIEPSSCAAFQGPAALWQREETRTYCVEHGLTEEVLQSATHIVWATGGSLVPEEIRVAYRNTFLPENV